MQAIRTNFGPYYESAIRKQLPQREAVGKPSLTGSELAGISYGELQGRYEEASRRKQFAEEMALKQDTNRRAEEQWGLAQKTAKQTEMSQMVTGGTSLMTAGAGLGTTIGAALAPAAATTAGTTVAGFGAGAGLGAAGSAAALSAGAAPVIGGAAAGGAAGVGTGVTAGATAGSILPGPGTIIGAIVGLGIGVGLSAAK
jgi:hypothetical protein